MSVRVNLLPEATRARDRANQQRLLAGLAGLVVLLLLGGAYGWAANEVSKAEQVLADEQAETSRLRARQAELVAFRDLAARRDTATTVLQEALGGEASMAALLQDLSAVMPADAQFETLTAQIDPDAAGGAVIGTFSITGRTLSSHAPGVERVLLSMDKIASLSDLHLNSSTLDTEDDTIASFSVDGSLGAELRTGRYADGLPETLR